jgi:ligand-binding SRPBCC domain-containing protein
VRERILRRVQVLDVPIAEAFDFFSRAENLQAITPPLLRFRITSPTPIEMKAGALIEYRLRVHAIPVSWRTRIEEWDPPNGFVDRQIRGPYGLWHHTHCFEELDPGRTRMTDIVRYGHRFGPLGTLGEHMLVRRDLDRIFDYRHDSIPRLLTSEGSPA